MEKAFCPFDMCQIICDLLEARMSSKYGYEPQLKITTPKYPVICLHSDKYAEGFWVAVVQIWNNVPIPIVEVHSTGHAYREGVYTPLILTDLKVRTDFLSTIESITTGG